MRSKYQVRPRVEALEDRWVPATVNVINGTMTISNQTGALVIAPQATAGKVDVTDNGKTVTYSGVGTSINVTGTTSGDSITFKGNTGFNGNLTINGGNGNDTIDLSGPILGNLSVLGGLGDDTITSTNADVKVGGYANLSDTSGTNTLDLNGRNWTVGTDLSVSGVSSFSMGAANTLKVGGNATFSGLSSGLSAATYSFNGLSVSVGKALTINGYSEDDTVNVTVTGAFSTKTGTTVNLGGGTNSFNLAPGAASTLAGTFQYTGSWGDDTVTLDANATLGGPVNLTLGDGSNTVTQNAGDVISGNLTVNGGSGGNNVTLSGTLNGYASFTYGNGVNVTTVNSVPSGKVIYRGGNNDDTLNLGTGAGTYVVDVIFGSGTNTLDVNATFMHGSVKAQPGASNTFNQNATDVSDVVFTDFP